MTASLTAGFRWLVRLLNRRQVGPINWQISSAESAVLDDFGCKLFWQQLVAVEITAEFASAMG